MNMSALGLLALGIVLMLLGVVMIPAPGPGWLVVLIGVITIAAAARWLMRGRRPS